MRISKKEREQILAEEKARKDEEFKKKHGMTRKEWYQMIGRKGGSAPHSSRPFSANRELARLAGTIGGLNRRGYRKDKNGQR